jgi:hypothetical protein
MGIQLSKIGVQVVLQGQEAGKVIGREHVPLHLAEDNLDLI